MSEFWALVDGEFGPARGRTLARDHVLRAMGYRTAQQALDGGEAPRAVWMALCDELEVPADRRWGADAPGPSARRGRR